MKEETKPVRHQHGQNIYVVHDVSIVTNNGKDIVSAVAFSIDDGPLLSTVARYSYSSPKLDMIDFEHAHLAVVDGFVDEVLSELREAAAYQRDLLRGMH